MKPSAALWFNMTLKGRLTPASALRGLLLSDASHFCHVRLSLRSLEILLHRWRVLTLDQSRSSILSGNWHVRTDAWWCVLAGRPGEGQIGSWLCKPNGRMKRCKSCCFFFLWLPPDCSPVCFELSFLVLKASWKSHLKNSNLTTKMQILETFNTLYSFQQLGHVPL